jgi:hypothetical protein
VNAARRRGPVGAVGAALVLAAGCAAWLVLRSASGAGGAGVDPDLHAPPAPLADSPGVRPEIRLPEPFAADAAPPSGGREAGPPVGAGDVAAPRDAHARWAVPPLVVVLEGTVRTTEGGPVEAAMLEFHGPGDRPGDPTVVLGSAATDAEGRYRMAGLSAFTRGRLDCTWEVALTGRTAVLELERVHLSYANANVVDVVVPVASTVITQEVRVQDPGGVPLADHRVELLSSRSLSDGRTSRLLEGFDVTGQDGRCRVPALAFGTKDLVVRGPGAGDLWDFDFGLGGQRRDVSARRSVYGLTPIEARKAIGLTAPDSPEIVLDVDHHDQALLTGFLFDERGLPLEKNDWPHRLGLETDVGDTVFLQEDGSFEVLVPKGAGEVRLVSPSYCDLPVLAYDTRFHQDVGAHRASPAAGLLITLQDTADGLFVPDATVRLRVIGADDTEEEALLSAEKDGSYLHWTGRSSGRYELTVTAPGHGARTVSGELQLGSEPTALQVSMTPGP